MACPKCGSNNTKFTGQVATDGTRLMECNACGYKWGTDWHIDAICTHLGFTTSEANLIKSEFDKTIQKRFGGNIATNTPEQYTAPRSAVRKGDPIGLTGWCFAAVRRFYFALEHIPVLNDLQFWANIDKFVLNSNQNETVRRYVATLPHLYATVKAKD